MSYYIYIFKMQKAKNTLGKIKEKIKTWSLRRKIAYGVLVLLVIFIIIKIVSPKDNSASIVTEKVVMVDLKQTVLATGQVTSNTDLNLSFDSSGVVKSLKVNVGDVVKKDQILATLDQGSVRGSLTSARGAYASAEAKYKKILQGSQTKLATIAYNNAKRDYDFAKSQQETLVKNAYATLLSSGLSATPDSADTSSLLLPTISGSYLGNEGEYKLHLYYCSFNICFSTTGLESYTNVANSSAPVPLGTKGLYIQFPQNFTIGSSEYWTISIPNKKSPSYVANYNAYQSALNTKEVAIGNAQAVLDQREAELTVEKDSAGDVDLDLARADILSAQGQVELATANFEHTVLRAPTEGTITKIDIKMGELAQSLKEVMVLQDVKHLYIESLINESNIAYLKVGQKVDITFDAFGKDKLFTGSILQVDPSSLQSDSVVNYKIKVSIDQSDDSIRPGMNANINIFAGSKDAVLAIPGAAIFKEGNTSFVNVLADEKKNDYIKREVITGFVGDGNMVEIVSGLQNNDSVVLTQK